MVNANKVKPKKKQKAIVDQSDGTTQVVITKAHHSLAEIAVLQ